jgi:hypothetical protein
MHTWIRASVVVMLSGMSIIAGSSRGQAQQAPQQPMGFFVTSRGPGDGGNLGGLAGADKHCQTLAAAAGAGKSYVACVSEHLRRREPAGRLCPRAYRERTLAILVALPVRCPLVRGYADEAIQRTESVTRRGV